MPAKNDSRRKARLAAALKENLKRRKAQARAKGAPESTPAKGAAKSDPAKLLGTAPQAGLEAAPEPRPNAPPKRQ